MFNFMYPESLRQLFTNRQRELAFLQSVADDLISARQRHVAIFGLRRIGKTLLLLEQLNQLLDESEIIPVYINFEDICSSPEIFAQRYIGYVTFWATTSGDGDIDQYLTLPRLLSSEAMSVTTVATTAGTIANELGRKQPDSAFILKQAFDFPQKLAGELGKKLILFLDEFTEIDVFSHYPGISDPLKTFRAAMQTQSDIAYIVAGSAITALEKMIKDHESPLFLQFEMLELAPFTREATEQLAGKIIPNLKPLVSRHIHRLSFGHPFYITAIARRISRLAEDIPDVEKVNQAFILETLSRDGQIYNYCRYLYDISLQKARGYGILKGILQVLAEEEELTLSEIARRIAKTPPATRGYLRWLMEVSLILEENKVYFYRDPILRYWVAHATKGIEIDPSPMRETLFHLIHELEEKFQRLSSELGRAKESEIRELITHFNGQEVDGDCFNVDSTVKLPKFDTVEPYQSANGQTEVDALAKGSENWVIEIKWRGKLAGVKELEKLHQAATRMRCLGFDGFDTPSALNPAPQATQPGAWFISKSGFTQDAIEYGRSIGIMMSDGKKIEQIAKQVVVWG